MDVNVVLDVLLDRDPHAESASELWGLVEDGQAEGFLSAHAVTAIHFLNARSVGPRMARDTTAALLSVFEVAAVDGRVLSAALALGWKDFEDAITAAAARRAKCDVLVTRNPRDFTQSPIRIMAPREAIAWIDPGSARTP
jgi:predicted nucleic acid-binding protein